MKNFIVLAIAIFLTSCTNKIIKETPLEYSYMPSYLNIDSIQSFNQDDTNRVIDSTLEDFVSISIDGGRLIGPDKDTMVLPPGVLISDRKAILYPFYKSGWERQQTELRYTKYLMLGYYNTAKAAEVLYQQRIVELKQEAKRTWLEKNLGYIGFTAGLATAILTSFALFGGVNIIK